MYTIDQDFAGGNIIVVKTEENKAFLRPDMRGTNGEWFYFNFRVRGAAGKEITFDVGGNYVSPFGVSISHDGVHYAFYPEKMRFTDKQFSYAFSADENETYFAFSMPYQTERFYGFVKKLNIETRVLCVSEGGREVPYIRMGNGDKCIVLSCRQHCCESVASYVLEGMLEKLKNADFLAEYCVYILPFSDIDGVENGDQGKNRVPHDHNRDYTNRPIYNVIRSWLSLLDDKDVRIFIDLHNPYLYGGENDYLSFVYSKDIDTALDRFSAIFEKKTQGTYFPHEAKYDVRLNMLYNKPTTSAKDYFCHRGAEIATTLETPYFGLKLPEEKAFIDIGKYLVETIGEYLKANGES